MNDIQKAKDKAWKREYYLKNKELIKARASKWQRDNNDRYKDNQRSYYNNNRDNIIKKSNTWYKNNPEAGGKIRRDYAKRNPGKSNASCAKRRAIKVNSMVNLTNNELDSINNLYQIAKDARITTGYDWHVDHIVPLSKGGLHTLNNLQVVPATWNLEKNNNNCDRYWD